MEDIKSKLENGVLEISNFDTVKNSVVEFVNRPMFNIEIISDEDYKELKKARTELNKRQKEITDGRLKITRAFCGEFEKKCKEIESILKEKSAEIGDKLSGYKQDKKIKIYTLEIKTADIELIAQIKAICDKANCEVKMKE